jgi:hypothetical protein
MNTAGGTAARARPPKPLMVPPKKKLKRHWLALARQLDATVEKSGGPQGTTVSTVAGAVGEDFSGVQVSPPAGGCQQ